MKAAPADIRLSDVLPLLLLPAVVAVAAPPTWPAWIVMWLLAGAIYVGCKWLTWATTVAQASVGRQLGYLFAWPGMDAAAFLGGASPKDLGAPIWSWGFAGAKVALGVALVGAVPHIPPGLPTLRGWVGMVGIVFVLHFGLFHLLSLGWRSVGVNAKPVMNWPVAAQTVSEFWSQRWNTAFRDLTHRFLFRPLAGRLDGRWAVLVGFLSSGLIHDLVISFPARGGYGGPTVYFVLQAVAILLQRSRWGRRLGISAGACGWAFTMAVLIVPVGLLFRPTFVRMVVVPFVDWLTPGAA